MTITDCIILTMIIDFSFVLLVLTIWGINMWDKKDDTYF